MALKQKAKIMIIDYFHYYDTIHSIMSILATSNKQQATSNKQQATSITTLTNSILIAKKYFINLNILSIFYGVIYEN
ncbi:hypothetical protein [Brachyspira hyodysenteriae]|uniref:hypothetical protein n=1 Tax=Brachyspira hyodysenteriae TaxID=159 RepID=UPI00063DD89B|nr:hypothetical protein [Brachyspira hyodysenteriae]KLI62291.1 hypothetical protein SZ46_02420 [Brachyspira hyodysenteriae]